MGAKLGLLLYMNKTNIVRIRVQKKINKLNKCWTCSPEVDNKECGLLSWNTVWLCVKTQNTAPIKPNKDEQEDGASYIIRSFTIFITIYHLGIGDFKSRQYYRAGTMISKCGNCISNTLLQCLVSYLMHIISLFFTVYNATYNKNTSSHSINR
jgi:hypothetical protein